MVEREIGGGNGGDDHAVMANHPLYFVPPPSEVAIFSEDDTDPRTWLAALKAQGWWDQLLRERISGRLAGTAFEWYGQNPYTNWLTFQRKFLERFDHIALGQCLRLIKEYTQQPRETLARYAERFTYLAECSGVDEKMVRIDFVRGLSDYRLRKKIRKKCNPIEHTLTELIQYVIKYGKENYDVGQDSESDEDDPSGVRRHSYSTTARIFEDRFGLGPANKNSDRKILSSTSASRRSGQAQGGRDENEISMKEVAAQLVTVVARLTEFVQNLQRQRVAATQRSQTAMAAGTPMTRPAATGAAQPLRCYNCNQPGHLAKDCPKPRTQNGPAGPTGPSQIPLAAATAAGQGRVATMMDTGTTEMLTPAATEIGPDEYMAAAMFEPGTIGVIRHVQRIIEESDLGPWRPGLEDLTASGPEYKDGQIDVLDALKALDLWIPVPIPYLLTISEAANEKLIERCLKNRRRFEESRKGKKSVLRDLPTNEESQPSTSKGHEANRVGMIQTVDPASEKPEALKEALTSTPVLARPDPTRQFALHTDWQPQAISAVRTQQGTDGREHVIEYASKTLSQAQSNYEACKGDCRATPPLPRVPDLNLDGAGPSAAAAGGGSRMGLPDPVPRPPVLAGPFRFRQPPRSAPIIDISSSSSRTVHSTEVDFMVEPTTIRLEAIAGAPRPDPAWEPYLTPPFQGCIAVRLAGTLIYETGQRPNVMYHFLVFAAQKRERRPYTETHLVMTGPGPRSVHKRVVRAVADLAPRVLSHVPGAFLYPSFVQHHFHEEDVPMTPAAMIAFLPPIPPLLNPDIDHFL
ncbi:hypothetical protein CBR_g40476 [Chara braunii]|uniref:CCHC-type domain-containing protein n=1 Tax=Chara braunii TaxID=69332 RepID=A0A388LTW0_CHABU|nr:hypothetical protein CBR_g40476 [Chara braunii]|eukprot:GBG85747.1 hypothetical protein CBR_g40476 [Chara braunii]